MYFYYFMLKRYQHNYQQVKCILSFLLMLSPIWVLVVIARHSSAILFHSLLFLTGWLVWTFVEYVLHRFWMHDKSSTSPLAQTHHYHHTHPTELVVTNLHRLAMIAILALLVLVANYFNDYFTFLVGFCFGIEGYFLIHQILHLKTGQKFFKRLVRYHIYHHCKYPNTCFGISVSWWDDLFRTVPKEPKITQRIIDFYFNDHKEDKQSLKAVLVEHPHSCQSCNHNCTKKYSEAR